MSDRGEEWGDLRDEDEDFSGDEVWRALDDFPNYHFSSWGRVRNICGRLLFHSMGAYPRITLTDKYGKSKTYHLHTIICRAFHKNPLNLPTVDHIDRNPYNPHADNLRWASYTQQNRNRGPPRQPRQGFTVVQLNEAKERIASFRSLTEAENALHITAWFIKKSIEEQTLYEGFYYRQDFDVDPAGFVPARFPPDLKHLTGLGMDAHPDGVLRFPDGRLTQGSLNKHGYMMLTFHRETFGAHRVLCATFHDRKSPEQDEVDHINEVRHDNKASNLEPVTGPENHRRSAVNRKKRKTPDSRKPDNTEPVLQYSLEGIFLKEYPSTLAVCQELQILQPAISHCLNGKARRAGDYMWVKKVVSTDKSFVPPPTIDPYIYTGGTPVRSGVTKEARKAARQFPVLRYSLKGEFLEEYASPRDAAVALKLRTSRIIDCANGKKGETGGSMWRKKVVPSTGEDYKPPQKIDPHVMHFLSKGKQTPM